ncbi:MAG: hypothetical protein K6F51_10425 [Acetatifactor sp.]|nr:hypothetical protein [Acetatifactor sp.]
MNALGTVNATWISRNLNAALVSSNVWDVMRTPLREPLVAGAMLLALLQGYLCLAHLRNHNKGRLMILSFLHFAILLALFYLLLDGMFHFEEPAYPRTWPAVTTMLCSLPVAAVACFELLSFGYLLWEFYVSRRFRKSHLTPWSVKETLDLLPAGVAFAQEDGNVVFSNLTMKEIANSLTGKILTNLEPVMESARTCSLGKEELQESDGKRRAKAKELQESDGKRRAKAKELQESGGKPRTSAETLQVALPDGSKVWQLMPGKIMESGQSYLQLTATDVTAQARINEELQGKNKKLRKLRRRLEIYNRTAEQIIISQELLNARMQVHNETGHVLLASRHYMDHPSAIDEEALLQTLKLTNAHLLKEYEEDDTERDALSEAIEMAGEIDVTVRLTGMIPEDGAPRSILAAAVSECATNTKKHADGDLLVVNAEETEGRWTFRLSGNGEPAEKPVSESGGLSSLRTLVENANGSMEVATLPSFTLIIKI